MSARHTSGRFAVTVLCALGITAPVAVLTAAPAFADQTITTPGPLSSILTTRDLNCAVNEVGDSSGEWYGDTACGTFLKVGTKAYGPAFIPAGSTFTAWKKVSQTAVTGSGTVGDPYTVTTVVAAGVTGVTLTQTDTYVTGDQSYQTDVVVNNGSATTQNVILYRAGDCYFSDSDTGFGRVDDGTTPDCVAPSLDDPSQPGTRIESMIPNTPGSSYMVDNFNIVWARIASKLPFANTCQCTASDGSYDDGLGLSWNLSIDASATANVSETTYFSPPPLRTNLSADDTTVLPGEADGFTVTISNPTVRDVTIDSITDTMPAHYTYTAGSTTGATTADPSVAGQMLTWAGPFTLSAGTDVTLHFGVTVSTFQTDAPDIASAVVSAPADQSVAPDSVIVHVHPVTITSVAPRAVAAGSSGTFTVHGKSLSAGGTATVSGTGVTLTDLNVQNSSTMSVHYSIDPGAAPGGRDFTYTDAGGHSGTKTNAITIDAQPTIETITPPAVGQGAAAFPVVLTGTGFRAAATVIVANAGVTKHFVNSTELDFKISVPAGHHVGPAVVTVNNGDGGQATTTITITPRPKPTAAAPAVPHGTTQTVTVTGSDYQSGLVVSGTAAGISYGTPTNVTATSFDVQVTVSGTTAARMYTLVVTNPDGGKQSAKILQVT